MLTAAQKEQWLKDLRSGEFKQGSCRMHTPTEVGDEYCCLGVLAERVGIIATGKGSVNNKLYLFPEHEEEPTAYGGMVPYQLLNTGDAAYVASLNDSGKVDFNEIADWIEANVVTSG